MKFMNKTEREIAYIPTKGSSKLNNTQITGIVHIVVDNNPNIPDSLRSFYLPEQNKEFQIYLQKADTRRIFKKVVCKKAALSWSKIKRVQHWVLENLKS